MTWHRKFLGKNRTPIKMQRKWLTLGGAVVLLLLSLFLNRGFFLHGGVEILLNHEDDSCYYLKIAQNMSEGHFFTFDKINKTNGFHPLWAGITTLLFLFEDNLDSIARMYMNLQMTLHLLSAILLFLLMRKLSAGLFWSFFAAICFASYSFFIKISVTGLETSLLLFLMLMLFFTLDWAMSRPDPLRAGACALVGTALVLTRLDAGLIIYFFGICAIFLYDKAFLRKNLVFFSVPFVIFVSYGLLTHFVTGSFLPVSGLMKRGREGLFDASPLEYVYRLFSFITLMSWSAYNDYFYPILSKVLQYNYVEHVVDFQRSGRYALPLVGVLAFPVLFVCAVAFLFDESRKMKNNGRAQGLFLILAVASFVQIVANKIAYNLGITIYYYSAPVNLFFLALLPVLKKVRGGVVCVSVLPLLLTFFLVLHIAVKNYTTAYYASPGYQYFFDAGDYLRNNTDENVIVASFNAGIIGFFSQRRTINLDGKVNSYEYLTKYKGHPERLRNYFELHGVDYYCDREFSVEATEKMLHAYGLHVQHVYASAKFGKYQASCYKIKPWMQRRGKS